MYPGISDLLNDLFGTHFTASFPPSFGMLVAISFLLCAWTLSLELKRKEKLGLVNSYPQTSIVGKPASSSELFWNALFGFILGAKILFIAMRTDEFLTDPQGSILSLKGNLAGGLVGAALMGYLKYREKQRARLAQPKEITEMVPPFQIVPEMTMVAAAAGILGAKIFHLLENWDDFIADPAGMFFSGSGLTMYGGLIVGAIAVLWFTKKRGFPPLVTCDAAAPGLMLAYGTGRIGCQLAGDGDWGIVNTAPKPSLLSFLPDWVWAYRYPHNVVNEGIPIPGCVGHHCAMLADPVFPTPLYESVACILLFFFLWSIRKKIIVPGKLFSIYLILNGIERFAIESIRVNTKYHVAGIAFTQAQLISLLLILTGVIGWIYLDKSKEKSPGPGMV